MHFLFLKLPILFVLWTVTECQEDVETSTEPQWAPTGRLNQFAGFATPRPQLLPPNAQMVYASVWAGWSAWSFCSGGHRIRVRACNTVRGFTCLGPNQESEDCDSTSEARRALRINTVNNDYDVLDPWQEDRLEALKQLYPEDTMDEKLSHLPLEERTRLKEKARFAPPTQITHELLLRRPINENDGAPGSTPERLFGARQFAVKTAETQDKLGDVFAALENAKDITTAEDKPLLLQSPFEETTTVTQETVTVRNKKKGGKFEMRGPKVQGEQFKNDIFGSIEELVKTTEERSTTRIMPTSTTTTSTTTVEPTTKTTKSRPPIRVTPKMSRPSEEEMFFELVTPSLAQTTEAPGEVITLDLPTPIPQTKFSPKPAERRPVKLHEGEVPPRAVRPTTTTTEATTTTTSPAPEMKTEEISMDTLHALDWMVANMTKAAQNVEERERSLRMLMTHQNKDSPKMSELPQPVKKLRKIKRRKNQKNLLHFGEMPMKNIREKFPKYRSRYVQKHRIFGIKTAGGSEINPSTENYELAVHSQVPNNRKELIQEINDLQELMVKIGSGVSTSDYVLPPPSYRIKHEHDSVNRT